MASLFLFFSLSPPTLFDALVGRFFPSTKVVENFKGRNPYAQGKSSSVGHNGMMGSIKSSNT